MPTTADPEGILSQRAGYDVPRDCRGSACLMAAEDVGYEIDEAEVIYGGGRARCVPATCAASGG